VVIKYRADFNTLGNRTARAATTVEPRAVTITARDRVETRCFFPLGGPLAIVRVMVNDAFDALANPIRRGIVERLASGPSTVGAATSGFAVSKPAISRHVKVLEDAGVVERNVQGRTHQLRLNVAVLNEAVDWLDRQRLVWDRMFDAVEDHLRAPAPGRPVLDVTAPRPEAFDDRR
jgi:DNA-binding transcriptional ArsR family regulator